MAYTYSALTDKYEFVQPMFFASPRPRPHRKSQDLPPPPPSASRSHPAQTPGQSSAKTPRRPPSNTPGRGSNSNLEYYPQGNPHGITRPGAYTGVQATNGKPPFPPKKRPSRLSTGPAVVPPPLPTPQRRRRESAVPTPGTTHANPGAYYRPEYAPPQDSRPRIPPPTAGPSPGVRNPIKKVRFGPYDGLSRYPSE